MNVKIISCVLLVSNCLIVADATTSVRPYLPYRSQGANGARNLAGMSNFYHKVAVEASAEVTQNPTEAPRTINNEKKLKKVEKPLAKEGLTTKTKNYVKDVFSKNAKATEKNAALSTKNAAVEVASVDSPLSDYGFFSVTPGYTRSFDGKAITNSLFGWWLQDCNTLNITGNEVLNRDEKDLLADWFYLDGAYKGSITFDPIIQNANVDLNMYWGMDSLMEGLYFRVDAPLVWSKWDLGARFKTENEGALTVGNYTNLASSLQYFCKKGVQERVADETLIHPLTSARFCGCECDSAKQITRLADIQMDLGWDFLRKEKFHIGAYVRGVAPTGNRPNGRWLFEPIVGNGHHWELGGGLTASALIWRNEAEDKHIGFYLDAYATHLFAALQNRVFDLKNMPLSRYMNAFRSNEPELIPVANLTATTINSSFAAQGEIVAMFNATLKNWSLDLGYNFWAQSCEKIHCSHWSHNCYGKGIIKNGYTESLVDASKWAVSPLSTIHTFVPPLSTDVIESCDIDYDGARSKGMSHKVFGHASYAWMDRDINPFIGVGAEGEFGSNSADCSDCNSCATSCSTSCNSCDDDCSGCKKVALSQWGIWLKGGISF